MKHFIVCMKNAYQFQGIQKTQMTAQIKGTDNANCCQKHFLPFLENVKNKEEYLIEKNYIVLNTTIHFNFLKNALLMTDPVKVLYTSIEDLN